MKTMSTPKTITFWNVDEMYADGERLGEPDEHSAEHRTGDAPDPADHGARERLESGDETHQLEDAAEDEAGHHARDAREHAPMKNAIMIVRSTSTPIIAAASRSCETARIDRPSFDRPTQKSQQDHDGDCVTITRIRISETQRADVDAAR